MWICPLSALLLGSAALFRTPPLIGGDGGAATSYFQFQILAGLAERRTMNSPIIKRSIILHAHKTSVSLEQPFWLELKSIAAERQVPLHRLIAEVDEKRQRGNLSSALRLFVLAKYRPAAADASARRHDPHEPLRKGSPP